jgi:hypothetical protein
MEASDADSERSPAQLPVRRRLSDLFETESEADPAISISSGSSQEPEEEACQTCHGLCCKQCASKCDHAACTHERAKAIQTAPTTCHQSHRSVTEVV